MIFRSEKQVKFIYSKTIIIPAKNEEGNLEKLIDRIQILKILKLYLPMVSHKTTH